MNLTERLNLNLGSIVSLMLVLGSVWSVATDVNDVKRDIKDLSQQNSEYKADMADYASAMVKLQSDVREIASKQNAALENYVYLVYMDEGYVILQSPGKPAFRMKLLKTGVESYALLEDNEGEGPREIPR